jgi:hypothetical protein
VSLTASLPAAHIPEQIVLRWFDAFNARDLDGMLMLLHPRVHFYPLKLGGLVGSYRGRDWVRDWWVKLERRRREYEVDLSDVCCVGEGRVLAVGSLRVAGEPDIGPFSALHRINEGLIVAAHHCLSDPEMIDRLGLIP